MPRAKAAATSAPVVAKKRVSGPVTERKRAPRMTKTAPVIFDPAAHYDEIAHAAYLNYVQRAGAPGSPEDDWLAAENSVRAKYVS